MSNKVLKIHPDDNVLVALQDIAKGETIVYNKETYHITDDIPAKHTFFLCDMNVGDEVIMYGVLVGKTQNFIPAGGLMTTSNIRHATEPYDYRGSKYKWNPPDISKFKGKT